MSSEIRWVMFQDDEQPYIGAEPTTIDLLEQADKKLYAADWEHESKDARLPGLFGLQGFIQYLNELESEAPEQLREAGR